MTFTAMISGDLTPGTRLSLFWVSLGFFFLIGVPTIVNLLHLCAVASYKSRIARDGKDGRSICSEHAHANFQHSRLPLVPFRDPPFTWRESTTWRQERLRSQ
mmetsp:Transcript_46178/g.98463  ORF Transcript_46178/g.98463 Transcript_46178/m.98463 type:complete len:102 (+) Transcript_46178:323-628(+)